VRILLNRTIPGEARYAGILRAERRAAHLRSEAGRLAPTNRRPSAWVRGALNLRPSDYESVRVSIPCHLQCFPCRSGRVRRPAGTFSLCHVTPGRMTNGMTILLAPVAVPLELMMITSEPRSEE
jgi:hypothetical protein